MTPAETQALEDQRLRDLRDARQRIVELQAVRAYIEESSSPAALLADVEALLAQALAREKTLIEQARQVVRPSRRRAPKIVAGLLVLGSWADDGVLALLEFALGGLPVM